MNEKLIWFPEGREPLFVSLSGITLPDSKYRVSRPHSDITVIEFVYSGEGYIKLNGKITRVGEGSVYMLCAGTDHEYFSDPNSPWKKVFINISGRLAPILPAELGLPKQEIYPGDGMRDIFERIEDIVNGNPDKASEAELIGLFSQAIFRLSRRRSESARDPEAAQMKAFIDSNSGRIVGNGELAALIYRSKDYCIRHFFEEYSVTPYDYQLSNKMRAAENMLKNTTLPVSAVAEALGYSDPQYFSGLFKRKIGISPREYRRRA